jgi:ABC-type proline/glycine betaine transport system permease subunit
MKETTLYLLPLVPVFDAHPVGAIIAVVLTAIVMSLAPSRRRTTAPARGSGPARTR